MIKREIFVFRKTLSNPIHIVQGTDAILFEFTVIDYSIPPGTIAVMYVESKNGSKKQICEVDKNKILLTPEKGLFEEGNNTIQLRVNHDGKELFTFCEVVKADRNISNDDAQEVEKQPTLVEQLLTDVGNTKEMASEALSIAKGKNRAHVFNTTDDLYAWLSNPDNAEVYQVGDNLYIVDTGVPDWWISEVLNEADVETGFYYKIAQLETQKVDLTEITSQLSSNSEKIAENTNAISELNGNSFKNRQSANNLNIDDFRGDAYQGYWWVEATKTSGTQPWSNSYYVLIVEGNLQTAYRVSTTRNIRKTRMYYNGAWGAWNDSFDVKTDAVSSSVTTANLTFKKSGNVVMAYSTPVKMSNAVSVWNTIWTIPEEYKPSSTIYFLDSYSGKQLCYSNGAISPCVQLTTSDTISVTQTWIVG